MVCKRCGAEIPDWFIICGICGTPVYDKFRRKQSVEENDAPRMLPPGREPGEDINAQRIPYGQGYGGGGPVISQEGAGFCRLSLILGIISLFMIWMPFLPIPVSLMAIAFGVLGYRRSIHSRGKAVAGIAVGSASLLLGVTISVCIAMLMPYADDLNKMMETYFQRMQ